MMALEGIKILDLSRLLPGPFCTMLLADMGATVLRVEDPAAGRPGSGKPADDANPMGLAALHRNKQSLCLNLKDPRGREIFVQLARAHDVLLEGFRPGVMDRLGLGYAHLSEINPRLVYCALSGYGQDGPNRLKPGHDINYLSLTGALSMTGHHDGPPVVPGVQVADIGGGSLMALAGILLALMARERTGRGQFVDISMTDGVAAWMLSHYATNLVENVNIRRGQGRVSGGMACYTTYRTRDDKYISVGAHELKFWSSFCQIIGLAELIPDHVAAPERQREMMRIVGEVIATRTRDEWVEAFRGQDVPVEPVLDVEEAVTDPQILQRQMIVETEFPEVGKVKQIGFPIKLSETPGTIRSPAVPSGRDSQAILRELGFSNDEIDELVAAGVINRPR